MFSAGTDACGRCTDELAAADSYVTWLADKAVKLRLDSSGPRSHKPMTLFTAFQRAVQRFPHQPALGMYSVAPKNCIFPCLTLN